MSAEKIRGKRYSSVSMQEVVLDSARSNLAGSFSEERDSVFADYESYCLSHGFGVFNNLSDIRAHLNKLTIPAGSRSGSLRGDDFLKGAVMAFRSLGEYADKSLLGFIAFRTKSTASKDAVDAVNEVNSVERIGYRQLDQSIILKLDELLAQIVDNNIESIDIQAGYYYIYGLEHIFEEGADASILNVVQLFGQNGIKKYNDGTYRGTLYGQESDTV